MSSIVGFGLGVAIGTFGTLIGAGGGFILVPLLLLMFPDMPAVHVTSISMLVVLGNAGSGSIAYARHKRVDWKAAGIFALATVPGAWLGIWMTARVPRESFERGFAICLAAVALFLFWRNRVAKTELSHAQHATRDRRAIYFWGTLISLAVGVLASFLGIGGGIIHVPLLSEALGFPVHLATGTSHVILAFTALINVIEHARLGHYQGLEPFVPYIVVGAVLGAQAGAHLSKRVASHRILQALAVALFLVALRLFTFGGPTP